jgi:integrase
VPVHSALIEAGIIKHGGKGPLWPELKASGPDGKMSVYLSKRFTHYRRKAGIDRDRLSFHSLRKNFVTALNQAGVHQADIAAVVGHAQGFTLDTYSGGPGLKRLQEVIEKVEYPKLKIA